MRVHPSIITNSSAKWYFPASVIVLLAILGMNIVRGPNKSATASMPDQASRQVIVAKVALLPGKKLSKEMLMIDTRPLSTLPGDVVTQWDEVSSQVPLGPIPAGYPLAKALFTDPKEFNKTQTSAPTQQQLAATANALAEARLSPVRERTVAVSLALKGARPEPGSRVALSLQGPKGNSALVCDEAWIELSDPKSTEILVRVKPVMALFLEEIKSFGTFSYLVIADQGESPFAGQTLASVKELREKLIPPTTQLSNPVVAMTNATSKKSQKEEVLGPGSFTSYAWTNGEAIKYSVDKDGRIFVIDERGLVIPLHGYPFYNERWVRLKTEELAHQAQLEAENQTKKEELNQESEAAVKNEAHVPSAL